MITSDSSPLPSSIPSCTNRRQSIGLTLNVTMNTHTYTWTQAGASSLPDARFEFSRLHSPSMRCPPPVSSSLLDWHKPTCPEHRSEALITYPQGQLCEEAPATRCFAIHSRMHGIALIALATATLVTTGCGHPRMPAPSGACQN